MNYIKHIILLISIIFTVTSCVDEKYDYIVGYVHTQAVSSIDSTAAQCGGELKITGKGNGVSIKIEENGILCSEDSTNLKMQIVSTANSSDKHSTKAKYFISNQTKEGNFPCQLEGLIPGTHYYARAYSVIICSYPNDKNLSYRNILYGDTKEFLTNLHDGSGNDTIPLTPIILSKPDSLTAHIWMYNCIWVQWKKVPDATTYEIWRSSSGQEGSYSLIYSGDCDWFDNCHYEDCKPLPENNYYKIKARNGGFESVFSDSVYCNFSLTNIDPCWVEITSVTGDASALTIVWQYSTDTRCGTPEKYIVKKRNTEGQYEFVAETTSNRYKDTSVHPGLNRYCVAAVNEHSESKCYESTLSPQIPFAAAPSGVTACISGQNVTILWKPVTWATGYQVLSSPDDNSSYQLAINGEVEGNVSSWTGTVYYKEPVYYKVRAVWFSPYIGGSPEYSVLSTDYAKVSAAPCTVDNLQASGNSAVTLSWSANSKCECATPTSYSVYKRNPNTGDMDIKKHTNLDTSYTDNSAHPGINEYVVVAVNNKGNSPIDDPFAFVSSESIPLSTPTNLQCKVAMGNLFRLSWTNVPQATGYRVYISTLPDGIYSPKYKVSANSNDAVFSYDGTSNPIYVKVQAVWESFYGNPNTVYSDFSDVVSVAFE